MGAVQEARSAPGIAVNGGLPERLLAALRDVALLATDRKLNILYANPHAREIFALPPLPASLGKSDLAPAIRERLTSGLQQGSPRFDLRQQIAGHEHVFDVTVSPLDNGGAQPDYVFSILDITAQEESKTLLTNRSAVLDAMITCDGLLHSQVSWRQVMDSVLAVIGASSDFGRVSLFQHNTDSSPATVECLFCWTASEKLPSHKTNHRDHAIHASRWLDALAIGQPIFGTLREFPPEEQTLMLGHGAHGLILIPIFLGEEWWGLLSLEQCEAAHEISPQALGALMSAGRSIGAAIQRENSTRRLNQAMIAFDSATEGIIITDEQTRIVAINQGFTTITGYSEEETLGKTPTVLSSNRQGREFYQTMWRTITNEGCWRGEIWNRRKNGEIYPEWLTITAVKDAEDHVTNYVAVFADISEVKQAQDRLRDQINRDPLTGLPNRRLLDELVGHAIRRAEREQNKLALLFIDLDRFKAINDTLGHQVGDKLLVQVAARLGNAVRESDAVARLGGDEFVVMMDFLREIDDASVVAKKIIQTLSTEFFIDGKGFFIGASVGISLYPDNGREVETLIKTADIAMYQVKSEGKNNFRFYSPDLSENAHQRFNMETQLRHAVERKQFEVYYQPQISIGSGRIIGAEALLRWRHPELGLVPPDQFIPLAEETGLIIQIGEWVLHEATRQIVQWASEGHVLQWIAVNVSGIQVQRGNFADTVYGVLVETDCDPGLLELEITESTIMRNTEFVISVFDRIKSLGVRMAIDDFGTGYSSLSHLKRLPLDKLKIDKSFVRELPQNADDAAIAGAITAMGRSLGLTIIAEGVETEEQVQFLRTLGCDELQGYLYSHPVPAAEFAQLLAAENGTKLK